MTRPGHPGDRLIRVERPVYWALVLLALVPVWLVDRFPSQDGPIHLYITYLVERLSEADAGHLREFFEYNRHLEPNALIYWLLGGLARVVPLLKAEKIAVSIYWLGLAGAARYAVGAVTREDRLAAFLFLPLGFGYFLHFGFYNFSFSLVGFLFLLGFALRRLDRLTWPTLAVIGAGSFLLVVTHLFGLAMFLAAFGMARLGLGLRRADLQGRAAWGREAGRVALDGLKVALVCLPAFAVAISFYLRYMQADGPQVPTSIIENVAHLASISVSFSLSHIELAAVAPYILLVWLLALATAVRLGRDRTAWLASAWVLLPAALLLAVYLLASIQVKHFSAQLRLLPFLFALLFLAIAQVGIGPRLRRLVVPVLVLAVVGAAVERARFYRGADTVVGDLLADARAIAPGSSFRTAYTVTSDERADKRHNGWRLDVLMHVPALVAIRRDAVSLNHDLLSPSKLGYFPVRHRVTRDPYRELAPTDEPRPLAWFERTIRHRVDQVMVWPGREPTPFMRARDQALLRSTLAELPARFRPVTPDVAGRALIFARSSPRLPAQSNRANGLAQASSGPT